MYESNVKLGGHTHTVDVDFPSGKYAIDTGFIVFNNWTYPNFIELMTQNQVKWQDSSMSFSVQVEQNRLEYNGTSFNSLFAQRRNFFRPGFYRMIQDILRFNRESLSTLESNSTLTLGEYLIENHYSKEFKDHYIVPMGAAIWSASVKQMDRFPVSYFVRFFKNHGMLSIDDRPVWKVIQGGSRSYIEPITRRFNQSIHLQAEVKKVKRISAGKVEVAFQQNGTDQTMVYDQVVLACHSDQALKILSDATPLEREILSGFSYQPNSTILHTDISVLPQRKLAWAAWNYWVPEQEKDRVAVSYNMNILQGIRAPETFIVSLNMDERIAKEKILARMVYHHPVFSEAAFHSQKRWSEISGKNGVHFCGAYWGYGFHEDGVNSAIRVGELFGEKLKGEPT